MNKFFLPIVAATALLLVGCEDDANVANRNLSKAAGNFEIGRRIVFINGITDKYLLEITGRCFINADVTDDQLEVICQSPDGFRKHFLGLSDNVSYMVEQIDAKKVSVNHYRVTFKPQSIIPAADIRGGAELPIPTLNKGKGENQ